MTDGVLTFAHGQVRLGSATLPGVLRELRVRGTVRFDEAEQDTLSGKTRTPNGWDAAAVSLTVDLLTEEGSTCYDKLAEIDALFRGHDNGANPRVLTVANAHVTARGVERVVFSRLESSETDHDDTLMVMLGFSEYRPPIIRTEKRTPVADTTTSDPGLDPAIGERSR